jgi:thiol-disulfide isomerase/thioredoxin
MTDKANGSGSLARPLLVTALAAIAGFAAVYVTLGRPDNAAGPAPVKVAAPPAAPAATTPASKLNVGEVAGFVFKKAPEELAEISFVDGEGKPRTLKDWQGRVVLLNLWATWCAPCRKEMPGLSRLQRDLGSPKFEVVALAVDRAGAPAAKKFLDSIDAKDLALYVDATARSGTALRAVGMPTTILIDPQGREIGRLTGPAEWDTPEAKRLVEAHIK